MARPSYATEQALWFLAACFLCGSGLTLLVVLLRPGVPT